MKIKRTKRLFNVKSGKRLDCGTIALDPNEQVTFTLHGGGQYDVTRSDWGFYATPSMNHRLPSFGLRAALIRTSEPRFHVVLVQAGKEMHFEREMEQNDYSVLTWFDQWT